MNHTDLYRWEKLLVAATGLPFTFGIEDLIVAAWRLYPGTFGLAGYSQHPDSNGVVAYVVGKKKGMVKTGMFDRVGPRLYSVTISGRNYAASLANGVRPERNVVHGLTPLPEKMMESGVNGEASLLEALHFWGIDINARGEKIIARLAQVQQNLRTSAHPAAGWALGLHEQLLGRFRKQLSVLAGRDVTVGTGIQRKRVRLPQAAGG